VPSRRCRRGRSRPAPTARPARSRPTNRPPFDRFIDEAQIAGQLEHPNIMPIYDVGTLAGGEPYYTMQRVAGATFRDVLEQRRRETDPTLRAVHRREAIDVVRKIAAAWPTRTPRARSIAI
jgi:serine/threonine protein kinase